MHGGSTEMGSPPERNMHLAEDQILYFEIVTTKESWTLGYVDPAQASVYVLTTVFELIYRRRGWINDLLVINIYAMIFFYMDWTNAQRIFRKLALWVRFVYNAVQAFWAWTGLAGCYPVFFFVRANTIGRSFDFH